MKSEYERVRFCCTGRCCCNTVDIDAAWPVKEAGEQLVRCPLCRRRMTLVRVIAVLEDQGNGWKNGEWQYDYEARCDPDGTAICEIKTPQAVKSPRPKPTELPEGFDAESAVAAEFAFL